MYEFARSILLLFVLLFGLCFLTGCKSTESTEATMKMLQEAKFEGHFIMATDAGVEAGETISFFLGARGTRLAVDGNIDFSDTQD